MLQAVRSDARFQSFLMTLVLVLFLVASPFQVSVEARLCNENCSAQPLTGCGVTCGYIDQYVYTVWNWSCYAYCDVWVCAYVHEGLFTQQCDTICSYDEYNDYCWVYLE